MNPSYLTEGYKSTGNNQTTGQNPTVHKGFSHIRRMSTRL
ncbi:conjugal transfer protein [Clostridium sp. AF37-5AT]|jgi:phage replication initiation protein|uniref:Conjugal transfer protein n=1 Tax=Mediterraneibacter gnavus TaxID=33038 RepID=A0A414S835_MEDGN|nr:conjugal transfer protein [Mediterraneibacter gnavus]RHO94646.1 conjugal transfer protein [Clostridium sp. AF37-5AT]